MIIVKYVVVNMTLLTLKKTMNAFVIAIKKKGNANGSVIIYQVKFRKK
jgi:hypothetical protein